MQIKTNKKYKQEIKGKDKLNLVQQITYCLPTAQLHSLEKPISTGKSNFWPISTGKTNFWLRSTTFKLQPLHFNCSSRKGWEWGDTSGGRYSI